MLVWEDATGSLTAVPSPLETVKELKTSVLCAFPTLFAVQIKNVFLFTKTKNVRLFLCAVVKTIFTPISTISFVQKKGVAPL